MRPEEVGVIVAHERCPLCEHPELIPRGAIGHRSLARCPSCGHHFAARYDAEALRAAYKEHYYPAADDPRLATWNAAHADVWAGLCRSLERARPPFPSLLDIGAGSGGFLQAFRQRHPQAALFALENDPEAREALPVLVPDLNIIGEDAADLGLIERRFHAITLLQTLEHLDDPGALCRAAHDKLEPGGALLITVPNRRSLRVLIKGDAEPFCMANPTHLHFFSRPILARLLKDSGFSRVERLVEYGGGGARPWMRGPQWLLRRLGLSSELRFLAIKGQEAG